MEDPQGEKVELMARSSSDYNKNNNNNSNSNQDVFVLDGSEGVGGSRGASSSSSSSSIAVVSFVDIFKQFGVLGWTAFGGPAAHIATFEQVFVQGKRWLSSGIFTEFLALGQCIPGPTSSQMAFAIGIVKKGIPGGLLSGTMFLHPGLLIMYIIGATTGGYLDGPSAIVKGLVAGFTAVAIALVATACLGLGKKICKDKATVLICCSSTFVTVYSKSAWIMPVLMLAGGLTTIVVYRKKDMASSAKDAPKDEEDASDNITSLGLSIKHGGVLLCVWLLLLILLTLIVEVLGESSVWAPLAWFKTFYTAGSLIFGGGQVLLPLLLDKMTSKACNACVPLMSEEQFFAGLAAAQSMPGPLFNFSAYLGAVIAKNNDYLSFFGTITCWVGLFSPGIMLIFGILPFWGWFRTFPLYKRALPGINAAAVGLIFTAVFSMTFKAHSSSPFPNASTSIGVFGFTAVQFLKLPAPLAVIAGGLLGLVAHAAKLQ